MFTWLGQWKNDSVNLDIATWGDELTVVMEKPLPVLYVGSVYTTVL